jgi:phosphoribosylpyrophosphate synthetase
MLLLRYIVSEFFPSLLVFLHFLLWFTEMLYAIENFRKFPDGFPNIFIPNAQGIRGQHVAFLASFSSPAVIFEQIPVIYALPKLFVASFTLVLPFFPTGTSERMEDEGDIATAFTLARLLSNIPISRGGPTSLVTFDIHALQVYYW